ncbi:RNA polymerase I-specific transcription initiation factor rrn7 [Metarhizium anisopliae]|nr:RNA polymerase I-specific transcription initiation factor rrn7 [Metarhizium anisopliae]
MGAVARREKEKREVEKRQLTGQEGRSLFLEAVQLLLRKQVSFLIRSKGHREELETVVRDLWDLRIRGYTSNSTETNLANTELEMFSSQSTRTEEGTNVSWHSRSRTQNWDPERGTDWPMPRMTETIVLCYLGCLLLRIPTRLADLYAWVSNGSMPYLSAFQELPREIQERMPSSYANVMKLCSRSGLNGEDLYRTVIDTVLSYRLNYDMTTQNIFVYQVCVHFLMGKAQHWLTQNVVEAIAVAVRLASVLDLMFYFPVSKAKLYFLDNPEVQLISLLVVATKMCFPLDPSQTSLLDPAGCCLPQFNWASWKTGFSSDGPKSGKETQEQVDFEHITPNQVTKLSDEKFDAYVAHLSESIGHGTETVAVSSPPQFSTPEEKIEGRARRILAQAVKPNNMDGRRREVTYEAFRTVEDISDISYAFYKEAGNAAGLSTSTMTRAIYMLEQRIVSWQKKHREEI